MGAFRHLLLERIGQAGPAQGRRGGEPARGVEGAQGPLRRVSKAASGLPSLAESIAGYEAWMRKQLGEDLVARDLKRKHDRMREHPFLFLRATCWRWAETAPILCPDLMDAPLAASVGDAHAGNFGLWRD